MKLRRPVMGDEEAQAAITVLRAVVQQRILVPYDEDKVKGALEALECAPVAEGDKSEVAPDAKQLGAYARKSDTSRAAAVANYPRSGTQRMRILAALLGGARATREQLAESLRIPENSVRPRVRELIDGGWVELATDGETGRVLTRKTALGNDSEVLAPTDKARRYEARQTRAAVAA